MQPCLYVCRKSLQEMAMTGGGKEDEEIQKEILLERDDPEALQKARDWDNWKDGEFFFYTKVLFKIKAINYFSNLNFKYSQTLLIRE